MFDLAEYAGGLYEKAALWDKVMASARLTSSGKWELDHVPHDDSNASAEFYRWVKGR